MSATRTKRARSLAAADAVSDIDAYIASLTDEQRGRLALAEVALDLADLLDRVREDGATSEEAIAEAGAFQQQVMSHFRQAGVLAQLGALQRYLNELGYALALDLVKIDTGESVGRLRLPTEADD